MLDFLADIMNWVCSVNQWMPLRLMEIKIVNLQGAEFKDTPKIKVKKYFGRLVNFAEILFW